MARPKPDSPKNRGEPELPKKRVGLYREICQVLLDRWRQVRRLPDQYGADEKLTVLRKLAATMMYRKTKVIEFSDAEVVVAETIDALGVSPNNRQNFLINLQQLSGILVETEHQVWAFAHHTFQEYLTAAHWSVLGPSQVNWTDLVDDPWWHEPLRLYVGIQNADPIAQAALDAGTPRSLALALDLPSNAISLSVSLREKINNIISGQLHSRTRSSFEPAAEAICYQWQEQFTPHLNLQLANVHINNIIYQLFILQTTNQFTMMQFAPFGWEAGWFLGDPFEAVTYIPKSGVTVFCDWLNNRDHIWRYRAIATEEIGQLGCNDKANLIWKDYTSQFVHNICVESGDNSINLFRTLCDVPHVAKIDILNQLVTEYIHPLNYTDISHRLSHAGISRNYHAIINSILCDISTENIFNRIIINNQHNITHLYRLCIQSLTLPDSEIDRLFMHFLKDHLPDDIFCQLDFTYCAHIPHINIRRTGYSNISNILITQFTDKIPMYLKHFFERLSISEFDLQQLRFHMLYLIRDMTLERINYRSNHYIISIPFLSHKIIASNFHILISIINICYQQVITLTTARTMPRHNVPKNRNSKRLTPRNSYKNYTSYQVPSIKNLIEFFIYVNALISINLSTKNNTGQLLLVRERKDAPK